MTLGSLKALRLFHLFSLNRLCLGAITRAILDRATKEQIQLKVKSMYDLINELLSLNHFFVEKMHDFDVFNECVTNQQTNRPMDTAFYRDARTHLKNA